MEKWTTCFKISYMTIIGPKISILPTQLLPCLLIFIPEFLYLCIFMGIYAHFGLGFTVVIFSLKRLHQLRGGVLGFFFGWLQGSLKVGENPWEDLLRVCIVQKEVEGSARLLSEYPTARGGLPSLKESCRIQ